MWHGGLDIDICSLASEGSRSIKSGIKSNVRLFQSPPFPAFHDTDIWADEGCWGQIKGFLHCQICGMVGFMKFIKRRCLPPFHVAAYFSAFHNIDMYFELGERQMLTIVDGRRGGQTWGFIAK